MFYANNTKKYLKGLHLRRLLFAMSLCASGGVLATQPLHQQSLLEVKRTHVQQPFDYGSSFSFASDAVQRYKQHVQASLNTGLSAGLAATEGLVDAQKNEKIAEWVLRQLNQKTKLVQDPWVQDTLNQLMSGINAQARQKALVASVIIDEKKINAFATPGGLIAVNSGLITQSRRVDELVSVLAHEVAHISQRHFDRRQNNKATDLLISLGGLVASAVIAQNDPKAASAVAAGSQAYMIDKQLAFSREQEKEADRIGMQIMQAAGYDPKAMPAFFALLSKQHGAIGYVPEFVLTHPLTQNRLSEALLRANHSKFVPTKQHGYAQQQFLYMKWRLLALADAANMAHIRHVANATSEASEAAKLALVTAYLRLGDKASMQNAQKVLHTLQKTHAEHSLYMLLQAQLWRDTGKLTKAKALLAKGLALYPESRSLRLMQANTLRLLGEYQPAIALLKPLAANNKRDVVVWQALAQTAKAMPVSDLNQLLALTYQAEVSFWQNNLGTALDSLARAKRLAKKYPSHHAKISKRLKQMQAVMKEA